MEALTVNRLVSSRIPTQFGEFNLSLYGNSADGKEHLAMQLGEVREKSDVLVRVHSECFTGDVLGSQRCDCGEQLLTSLKLISENGEGVLLYLRQEGRGIGLLDKLRAYNLQDQGYDTVDANLLLGHQADERDYSVAAALLKDLGVKSVQLITNNPKKMAGLRQLGVDVTGHMPIEPTINPENEEYLRTKVLRMNHMINLEEHENGQV